jgi:hypothetical protein
MMGGKEVQHMARISINLFNAKQKEEVLQDPRCCYLIREQHRAVIMETNGNPFCRWCSISPDTPTRCFGGCFSCVVLLWMGLYNPGLRIVQCRKCLLLFFVHVENGCTTFARAVLRRCKRFTDIRQLKVGTQQLDLALPDYASPF